MMVDPAVDTEELSTGSSPQPFTLSAEKPEVVPKAELVPAKPAKTPDTDKVSLSFQHVGNAPILKKKVARFGADRNVAYVYAFLRKMLSLPDTETLFLYVNDSFAPCPETLLGELCECFGRERSLTIRYCLQPAYG